MNAEMKNRIIGRIKTMQGDCALYFKNLETGEILSYNENAAIQAASVIKLPTFMWYLKLADEGKLSLEDELTVTDADRVGGCGTLRFYKGDQKITIDALLKHMITVSDNTATNVLMNHIGLEELNRGFKEMGLETTKLLRIMFDSEAASRGLENTISALEMGTLLEKLYRGEWVSKEVSEYAVDVLSAQQINHKIPGIIGWDTKIAHKTGDDDGIANDVGIVYTPQPCIMCFASTFTVVPDFELFIRETAYELYLECGGKAYNE